MLEFLKRLIAGDELARLNRYRYACHLVHRWMGSFPAAAEAADWIRQVGEDERGADISQFRGRIANDEAQRAAIASTAPAKAGADLEAKVRALVATYPVSAIACALDNAADGVTVQLLGGMPATPAAPKEGDELRTPMRRDEYLGIATPAGGRGEDFEAWYKSSDARFWNNWDACAAAFTAGRSLASGGSAPSADGVSLIAAERQRQITAEGWTQEHDTEHDDGELARAAALYATPPEYRVFVRGYVAPQDWPWAAQWWKPGDRIRELTKAGALIAAEIDRLQRAAAPTQERP